MEAQYEDWKERPLSVKKRLYAWMGAEIIWKITVPSPQFGHEHMWYKLIKSIKKKKNVGGADSI